MDFIHPLVAIHHTESCILRIDVRNAFSCILSKGNVLAIIPQSSPLGSVENVVTAKLLGEVRRVQVGLV
jgi:hypothetical protein